MEMGERNGSQPNADVSTAFVRIASRIMLAVKRPLWIVTLLLLATFVCRDANAQTVPVSESKTHFDRATTIVTAPVHHHSSNRDKEVPLLFLGLLGLGLLTLSQTRPTSARVKRVDVSCTGKNDSCGQELPEGATPLATR